MTLPSEKLLLPSPLDKWENELFEDKGLNVFIKRDDLIHPVLSGNKYRKLKHNFQYAQKQGYKKLLSFGGAYSNHLYAMAGLCKYSSFEVEVLVRGEELNTQSSPTLKFANDSGVKLTFVSRTNYRNKQKLIEKHGKNSFVIPEGGSNVHCLLGVQEMVKEVFEKTKPTHICCAMGTGGTAAGILSTTHSNDVKVVGIPVLKGGDFLKEDVESLIGTNKVKNLELMSQYHFGGYAKYSSDLLTFINEFEAETQVALEQVYTGKLFFAIKDQISKGYFKPESAIVIYHSGGLQGKIKEVQQ